MDSWRAWLLEHLPLLLREPIQNAPDWLLPVLTVLVIGLLIYLCLEFVQRSVIGLRWLCRLVTNPIEAGKQATVAGRAATAEDLQRAAGDRNRQMAEILAELRELRAEKQARGEVGPTDALEEARTAEAVQDVLDDPGLPARAAADAMREGRIEEAFAILRKDAASGEAETAERWRRLGALARGIDTAQALEAYEAAFRIQPSDFWTCIELCRLRVQTGDLTGAEASLYSAKYSMERSREKSVLLLETAEIRRLQTRYREALVKLREAWRLDRKLYKNNQNSLEMKRDLSVTSEKISQILILLGKFDLAIKFCHKSISLTEEILQSSSDDRYAMRDIFISKCTMADIYYKLEDFYKAKEIYFKCLQCLEAFQKIQGSNIQNRRDIALIYNRLSSVEVSQNNYRNSLSYS